MQLFLYLKLKIPSFPSLARTPPRARHARPRDAPFGTCRKADTSGRNASRRHAERASVLCGEYSSTSRKVQIQTPHAGRTLSATGRAQTRTTPRPAEARPPTVPPRPSSGIRPTGVQTKQRHARSCFFLSLWHGNHVFFILLPLTNIT